MDLQRFIADSAPEAVAQIRAKLGPDAVVVNVRRLSGAGLSRLWQKPRIEVLAFAPQSAESNTIPSGVHLGDPGPGSSTPNQERPDRNPLPLPPGSAQPGPPPPEVTSSGCSSHSLWGIGALLESTGLLPVHAHLVAEKLASRHGLQPPVTLNEQIRLVKACLTECWRPVPVSVGPQVHIFVGTPGSGKTTCLCQWLTRSALLEGRTCRVWRLDGRTANNAESLSVYAEVLGVPIERFVPETPALECDSLFVDLPGVNANGPGEIQALAEQLHRLPKCLIHLVLNAAYETGLLFAQVRAFSVLPINDLIFTHLDEEPRWGKLWNFILGTNYTIGCLSAGQNVPGDFQPANPERILSRQFPR